MIFTKTEAVAQRVYGSIERFLTERLKLSVNHDKSSIRRTDGLEYVGYELRGYGGQIRVSKKVVGYAPATGNSGGNRKPDCGN